jgi:hypothetical protein
MILPFCIASSTLLRSIHAQLDSRRRFRNVQGFLKEADQLLELERRQVLRRIGQKAFSSICGTDT